MAGENLEASNINSNTSFNNINYSLLLQAFIETHEEANILALSRDE